MAKITLYGIKNCDTVKKARRWLEDHRIDYRFHDVREDGLDAAQVDAWLQELGMQLVNKRSTGWKTLTPTVRETLTAENASAAILEMPTLIKRPLLDTGRERHVGFKATDYEALFAG